MHAMEILTLALGAAWASGINLYATALLIGGLGLLRLPDVFARMHGAGMVDTLGLALILLGLMVQAGFSLVTVKLILIMGFVLYTSPTTTHALARACLYGGQKPEVSPESEGEAIPTDSSGGPSSTP